jgi:spermidine synthase
MTKTQNSNMSDLRLLFPILLTTSSALAFSIQWSHFASFYFGAAGIFSAPVMISLLFGFALGSAALAKGSKGRSRASSIKLFVTLNALAVLYAIAAPAMLSVIGSVDSFAPLYLVLGFGAALFGSAIAVLLTAAQGAAPFYKHSIRACSVGFLGALLGLNGVNYSIPIFGHQITLLLSLLPALLATLIIVFNRSVVSDRGQFTESDSQEGHLTSFFTVLLAMFTGAQLIGFGLIITCVAHSFVGSGMSSSSMTLQPVFIALMAGSVCAQFMLVARARFFLFVSQLLLIILSFIVMRAVAFTQEGSGSTIQLLYLLIIAPGFAFSLLLRLSPRTFNPINILNSLFLGAALGLLVTELLLIPRFGLRASLLFWAGGSALIALSMSLIQQERRALQVLSGVVATLLLCYTTTYRWSETLFIGGHYANPTLDKSDNESQLVYYKNSHGVIISVEDDPVANARILKRNGRVEGVVPIDSKKDSAADLSTTLAQAAFPILLSSRPETICLIGLGTGVTLGAMFTYEVKEIDVVESQAGIIEALKDEGELFGLMNNRALEDERLSLFRQDAVRFLRSRPGRYDVISCRPLYPWVSRSSLVHTRDFYQFAKAALRQDGIFCLSLSLHSHDLAALKTQLATFLDVFPGVLVFNPPGTVDLLLMGGVKALTAKEVEQRMRSRGRKKARRAYRTHARDLFSCFISGPKFIRDFTKGAAIETVDHPRLCYRASELQWTTINKTNELLTKLSDGSRELFDWLLDKPEVKHRLLHGCAETRALRGSIEGSRQFLEASFDRIAALEEEQRGPMESSGRRLLGDLFFRSAKPLSARDQQTYIKRALLEWRKAIVLDPKNVAARRSLAVYHLNRRDFDKAIDELKPGLTGNSKEDAPIHFVMGRIYEAQKEYQLSWEAYRAAGRYGQARQRAIHVEDLAERSKSPIQRPLGPRKRDVSLLVSAGKRYLSEKKWKQAASVFREVTQCQPDKISHWYRLAKAYRGAKKFKQAFEAISEILTRKPRELRALKLRASLFEESGSLEDALTAWQQCVDKQSGSFGSVTSLSAVARIYLRLGKAREALAALDRANAIVPEHLLVCLYRGTAYTLLKDVDKARKSYEKYMKLAPITHPMRARIQRWLLENQDR